MTEGQLYCYNYSLVNNNYDYNNINVHDCFVKVFFIIIPRPRIACGRDTVVVVLVS